MKKARRALTALFKSALPEGVFHSEYAYERVTKKQKREVNHSTSVFVAQVSLLIYNIDRIKNILAV